MLRQLLLPVALLVLYHLLPAAAVGSIPRTALSKGSVQCSLSALGWNLTSLDPTVSSAHQAINWPGSADMGRIEKTPLHDCMKPHAFRGPRACVMEFPTIQEPLATIRSEVAAVHMLTMHAVCWSAIAYAQGLATTLLDLLALPYRSMTVVSVEVSSDVLKSDVLCNHNSSNKDVRAELDRCRLLNSSKLVPDIKQDAMTGALQVKVFSAFGENDHVAFMELPQVKQFLQQFRPSAQAPTGSNYASYHSPTPGPGVEEDRRTDASYSANDSLALAIRRLIKRKLATGDHCICVSFSNDRDWLFTGHVNGVDVFVLLSTNGGPFTVYIVDEVMQELGIPSQFAALAFVAGAATDCAAIPDQAVTSRAPYTPSKYKLLLEAVRHLRGQFNLSEFIAVFNQGTVNKYDAVCAALGQVTGYIARPNSLRPAIFKGFELTREMWTVFSEHGRTYVLWLSTLLKTAPERMINLCLSGQVFAGVHGVGSIWATGFCVGTRVASDQDAAGDVIKAQLAAATELKDVAAYPFPKAVVFKCDRRQRSNRPRRTAAPAAAPVANVSATAAAATPAAIAASASPAAADLATVAATAAPAAALPAPAAAAPVTPAPTLAAAATLSATAATPANATPAGTAITTRVNKPTPGSGLPCDAVVCIPGKRPLVVGSFKTCKQAARACDRALALFTNSVTVTGLMVPQEMAARLQELNDLERSTAGRRLELVDLLQQHYRLQDNLCNGLVCVQPPKGTLSVKRPAAPAPAGPKSRKSAANTHPATAAHE